MNWLVPHSVAQAWTLLSAEGRLAGWKRSLLKAHLKACKGCRSHALLAAEFVYGFSGKPKLKEAERALLHRSVMAAYHRGEAKAKGLLGRPLPPPPLGAASYGGVRPGFVMALLIVALVEAAIWFAGTQSSSSNPLGPDETISATFNLPAERLDKGYEAPGLRKGKDSKAPAVPRIAPGPSPTATSD